MSNSAVLRGKVSRCKSATEFPRKCGRCVKIERQNLLGKIVAATEFPRKNCRRDGCLNGSYASGLVVAGCFCRSQVYQLPVARPVASYPLPATRCQLPVASYPLPATRCQLPVASYPLQPIPSITDPAG